MKRFLLISDIHAADVDASSSKAPSYVSSFRSPSSIQMDPISSLDELIAKEALSPECILCPGDITNRSAPGPFGYAWERLHNLAAKHGMQLIATIGNHDVDSRYKANSHDPRGFAMSLAPTIPVTERQRFLEFWAENFTIVSGDIYNIIVLNTAAYHGAGRDAVAEIEHGRISDSTIRTLRHALKSVRSVPINIFLCHHHLIRPGQQDTELRGQTRGGENLIQLLGEDDSPWIIVHGHKHVPDLFYAYGGANAPVVLGCASFSAQINNDAQNKNPNQVHFLICDPDEARAGGVPSCGTVMSWTWQPGVGWSRAVGIQGLPYVTGFGHRSSVEPLVDAVDAHLTQAGSTFSDWETVTTLIPALRRLIPSDFKRLERAMARRGLAILTDNGNFVQVGRRS